MLTVDMVRAGARRHRDRVAIRYGDRSLTFRQVDEAANRMANVLLGMGVEPGERVGLLLGNGLWTVPLDFACLKARACRVPLNARLSAEEHARMLADAGVRTLVHESALTGRADELSERLDGLRTLGLGDLLEQTHAASAADPRLPARPDDVILALYTSGTTGTLKAAQHTQASYAAIVANIMANLVSPAPDDVMLHAAPLIHASGTFVLPFWLRGAQAAVLDGFDPQAYLAAIPEHGVTHANLVPTMLQMLLAAGGATAETGRLRSVIYGASPMPRPVIEEAMAAWGPIFTQYYGQTEAPLCLSVLPAADHVGPDAPLGSCGHPSVDAEIRLVDEHGADVADGEPGEIAVRAPFAMAGYLNAPELNATTFLGDGWLRTRDVARFDDRGYLYLVDRTSDMIVSGAYNVYPREVEDALHSHPAVAECAVVGAPDERWVEAVVAFVVPRPGVTVTGAELTAHVRARLAGYKVPKRVEFVAAIPKSGVGKVLRRALRDPLWAGVERTGGDR
ncbi:class I adenylate-forming enzyme family protein [Actinoallomurus iriomotensis]|uniref:Acyl-CoA synthetase n=1 Tax=Actinoallomurus iriomotensis TaxID=478107 RepID=A0A9W6RT15_9ACTN|nr:AMP-binding protein [Actinoallomurus iriomotensis]GLY81213.1 acyl-CoA synthetase [Actinoallomurus iriomotensis]